MTPEFAEDSTPITLAPSLLRLVQTLDENSNSHDHVMAFIIVLMAETGYRVSSLYDELQRSWSKEITCIPKNWKSGVAGNYEIIFRQYKQPELSCKLIGISSGDYIIVNFISLILNTGCKVYSTGLNASKYINIHGSDINFKFWNVKELALRFKNHVSAPLHAEMMMEQGLPSPCLQGLPEEIKMYIMKMLDSRSSGRLACTCKAFSELFVTIRERQKTLSHSRRTPLTLMDV